MNPMAQAQIKWVIHPMEIPLHSPLGLLSLSQRTNSFFFRGLNHQLGYYGDIVWVKNMDKPAIFLGMVNIPHLKELWFFHDVEINKCDISDISMISDGDNLSIGAYIPTRGRCHWTFTASKAGFQGYGPAQELCGAAEAHRTSLRRARGAPGGTAGIGGRDLDLKCWGKTDGNHRGT